MGGGSWGVVFEWHGGEDTRPGRHRVMSPPARLTQTRRASTFRLRILVWIAKVIGTGIRSERIPIPTHTRERRAWIPTEFSTDDLRQTIEVNASLRGQMARVQSLRQLLARAEALLADQVKQIQASSDP
jgi:hypothetical protein